MKYILTMLVLYIRESCNIISLYNYKNAIPYAQALKQWTPSTGIFKPLGGSGH